MKTPTPPKAKTIPKLKSQQQWQLHQQIGGFSADLNQVRNLSEIQKQVHKVSPLCFLDMPF